ncbi:MAG: hypothetical protein ABW215_20720 [Kibdelosporangium sp.]
MPARQRGPVEALRYLELCARWNDVFVERSWLRGTWRLDSRSRSGSSGR